MYLHIIFIIAWRSFSIFCITFYRVVIVSIIVYVWITIWIWVVCIFTLVTFTTAIVSTIVYVWITIWIWVVCIFTLVTFTTAIVSTMSVIRWDCVNNVFILVLFSSFFLIFIVAFGLALQLGSCLCGSI